MPDLRIEKPLAVLDAAHQQALVVCPAVNTTAAHWRGGLLAELERGDRVVASAGTFVHLAAAGQRHVRFTLPAWELAPWTAESPTFHPLKVYACQTDGRRELLYSEEAGFAPYRSFSSRDPFWRGLRLVGLGLELDVLRFESFRSGLKRTLKALRRAGLTGLVLRPGPNLPDVFPLADRSGLYVALFLDRRTDAEAIAAAAHTANRHPAMLAWIVGEDIRGGRLRRTARQIARADTVHPVLAAVPMAGAWPHVPPGVLQLRPARKVLTLGPVGAAMPVAAVGLGAVSAMASRRSGAGKLHARARAAIRAAVGDVEAAVRAAVVDCVGRAAAWLGLTPGAAPALTVLPAECCLAGGDLRALARAVTSAPGFAFSLSRVLVPAGGSLLVHARTGPSARDAVVLACETGWRELERTRLEKAGPATFRIPPETGERAGAVTARFLHGRRKVRREFLVVPPPPPELAVAAYGFDASPEGWPACAATRGLGRLDATRTPVLLLAGARLAAKPRGRQRQQIRAFLSAGGHVVVCGVEALARGWLPVHVAAEPWRDVAAAVDFCELDGALARLPQDERAAERVFLEARADARILCASALPGVGRNRRQVTRCGPTALQIPWQKGRISVFTSPFGPLIPLFL